MNKLIPFTILLITAIICSCKKDDDSTLQPKGNYPQASTTSFTLYSNNWGHIGTFGNPGDGYEADLLATNISNDIASTGTVLCYVSFDNVNWIQISFTLPLGTSPTYPYSESWNGGFRTGNYFIDVQDNDFLTSQPNGVVYARVVAMTHAARMKNPMMDLSNYQEVKRVYNLND